MVKDDDYGIIAVQPCLVCCFAGLADMVATENFVPINLQRLLAKSMCWR